MWLLSPMSVTQDVPELLAADLAKKPGTVVQVSPENVCHDTGCDANGFSRR